jgi:hypothetical protein
MLSQENGARIVFFTKLFSRAEKCLKRKGL